MVRKTTPVVFIFEWMGVMLVTMSVSFSHPAVVSQQATFGMRHRHGVKTFLTSLTLEAKSNNRENIRNTVHSILSFQPN